LFVDVVRVVSWFLSSLVAIVVIFVFFMRRAEQEMHSREKHSTVYIC